MAAGLNRGLSSNFWWQRNANYVKITEECAMSIEKFVLVKKNLYKWLKLGLNTTSLS